MIEREIKLRVPEQALTDLKCGLPTLDVMAWHPMRSSRRLWHAVVYSHYYINESSAVRICVDERRGDLWITTKGEPSMLNGVMAREEHDAKLKFKSRKELRNLKDVFEFLGYVEDVRLRKEMYKAWVWMEGRDNHSRRRDRDCIIEVAAEKVDVLLPNRRLGCFVEIEIQQQSNNEIDYYENLLQDFRDHIAVLRDGEVVEQSFYELGKAAGTECELS